MIGLVVDAPALREALRALPAPPTAPPADRLTVDVGVNGGGSVGRTPEWSGTVGLYGALGVVDALALRLDVTAFLPGDVDLPPHRLSTWGGDAGLSVCPRIEARPFRLDLCAGAHAGFVAARGDGFDRNEASLAGTLDLAVWAHPALRFDAVVITVDVGFGVALLRPEFVFYDGSGVGTIYQPSLLFGRLGASVGISFD